MKRRWIMLLALVLVFTMVFVACGPKQEAPAEDKKTEETEKPADDAKKEEPKDEDKKEGEDKPAEEPKKEGDFWTKATQPDLNPQLATGRGKDTLVVGSAQFNGVFNPLFRQTTYDQNIIDQIFDSTLKNDPEGNLIDNICKLDVISATEYKLTIVQDVKFSDGKPVTADDIKFAYLVAGHPDFDGVANFDDAKIVGYAAYQKGEAEDIEGIVVSEDKKEITFKLEEPNVLFKFDTSVAIYPSHYYAPDGKIDIAFMRSLNEAPMGSGPYKFVSYTPGQEVVLEANEDYWQGKPQIPNIIFKIISSSAELSAVLTGDVDIMELNATTDNRMEVEKAGFLDLCVYPTNGYGYVGMNQKANPILADKTVRQAIAHSINRKGVTEAVYGEFGNEINIVQSRVSPYFTDEGVNKYEFDLAKATELFKEAGWEKNANGILEKDGQPLKINFLGMEDNPVQKILVPEMIKDFKEVGIDFSVEYVDWATLSDRVQQEEAEMWFMAWGLSINPDNANIYGTDKDQNHMAYSNPALDALYQEAYKETDEAKEKAIWGEIYRTINEDAPAIPIYQRSDMIAANTRVQNLTASPYYRVYWDLWKATID